jgi:Lar family restriction alleviation protein
MSQRELADAVGVTEVAMSRYLNDGRMPKGPILYNMAKVLGVSVDDLLAGPEEKDCTSCEYGPVWNDVCRTCRGTGQTNADPEETVAGSGPQAEKEAGNILDQLIRKEDALKIFNGIISVPRKTPDESITAFQEHLQKLADRIKALPAEGTAEPNLKHCPFCGGRAKVVEQGTGISCAWVECGQCGTRTRPLFGENKVDRVVAAWNRRMPWMLHRENEEIEKRIPRWEENKMPHIKGEIRTPEA